MIPSGLLWFFMVPGGFLCFFYGSGWFFMVPGRFSWFFMVPGWFFIFHVENTLKLYSGPTIQSLLALPAVGRLLPSHVKDSCSTYARAILPI